MENPSYLWVSGVSSSDAFIKINLEPKESENTQDEKQVPSDSKSIESSPSSAETSQAETEICFKLTFTVTSETKDKLEQAKEKLSGKYPLGASLETTLECLLDSFLEQKKPNAKQKARKTKRPEKLAKANTKKSRYISKRVREEVFERDNNCCSYISPDGKRCASKWDLELDHIEAFSLGGSNEACNLRVRCRAHNALYATQVFGPLEKKGAKNFTSAAKATYLQSKSSSMEARLE